MGIRGADRAVRVTSGLRPFMPDLLALSASSPFVENVDTGLHSARTQIFTRMFPRCGVPDPLGSWREFEGYVRLLYETGSITEHTQLWWSVRSHLAFPTVEMRICDAQPDLPDARALAALIYALTARVARALDEGEPLPDPPPRLIEENMWRAIRYGLSGDLINLGTHEVRPARQAIEELIEWVCRLRRSSAPRRTWPCRWPTRPSARSPASRRARACARSTASCSCARRSRSVAERDSGIWVPPGGSADRARTAAGAAARRGAGNAVGRGARRSAPPVEGL